MAAGSGRRARLSARRSSSAPEDGRLKPRSLGPPPGLATGLRLPTFKPAPAGERVRPRPQALEYLRTATGAREQRSSPIPEDYPRSGRRPPHGRRGRLSTRTAEDGLSPTIATSVLA